MNELENTLRTLKLKKAMLFYDIESLSTVNDSMYLTFGKVEAEILKLEKEIIRKTKNTFE